MSVELILLSVNINLVAFSAFLGDLTGQVFALFILTVAAAEAAIGLAILVTYYRNRGTIAVEDINLMKGSADVFAIVFLPLAGFLIAGLFGRLIGARASELITTSLLFVAASWLAWVTFVGFLSGQSPSSIELLTQWFDSGALHVEWALRVDTLTAVMLVVVTTVSALVHLYSIGYMSGGSVAAAILRLSVALHLRHAHAGDG